MNEEELNIVASVLNIKASGLQQDPLNDLNMPNGKSIAELLNDQEEKNNINK